MSIMCYLHNDRIFVSASLMPERKSNLLITQNHKNFPPINPNSCNKIAGKILKFAFLWRSFIVPHPDFAARLSRDMARENRKRKRNERRYESRWARQKGKANYLFNGSQANELITFVSKVVDNSSSRLLELSKHPTRKCRLVKLKFIYAIM